MDVAMEKDTTIKTVKRVSGYVYHSPRDYTYHFLPRSSREMNLGMIFSGNW
jgi:hypothetical protein